jgi:23S rRNA pseudouridine2604 synthase
MYHYNEIEPIFARKKRLGFSKKLLYHLVHLLKISNKASQELLINGSVKVNDLLIKSNVLIEEEDSITVNGKLLKEGRKFSYFMFHKPKGIECTMDPLIKDNLLAFLPQKDLFNIGRLDKASTGLLIFTNDGRIYDKVLRHENDLEKEYWVSVDQNLKEEQLNQLRSGIKIMGKMTLPCTVERLSENSFKIILKQGLNRQIRRMCFKLGLEVISLHRVRIGLLLLGNLETGKCKAIKKSDIF